MRRGKHKILMSVNKTNLREKRHNNDNDTKAIYFVGRVEVTYKSHEFMVSLVKCQSISFVIISINIADVIIFHKLLLLRKYFDEYKMRKLHTGDRHEIKKQNRRSDCGSSSVFLFSLVWNIWILFEILLYRGVFLLKIYLDWVSKKFEFSSITDKVR